jgi:hypothetical protein
VAHSGDSPQVLSKKQYEKELNLTSHLLEQTPYEPVPAEKVALPPRQERTYVRPSIQWLA